MNDMLKIVINSFAKLMFSNISSMIIGLITFPLMLKNLSKEEYGVYVVAFSLVSLVSIIQQLNSPNSVLPIIVNAEDNGDFERAKSYLKLHVFLGITLLIIGIIIMYIIGVLLYNFNIKLIFFLLLYVVFSQFNTYAINISLMYKKYSFLSIAIFLRNFIRLIILVILINNNFFNSAADNILSYVYSEFLLMFFSMKIYIYIYNKYKEFKTISLEYFDLIKQGIYNFLSNGITEGGNVLIISILKVMYGLEVVGVYGAIRKFIGIIMSFYNTFENSLFPYIATWINKKDNSNKLTSINKIITLCTVILVVVINLPLEYIIKAFVGKEYLIDIITFRIAMIYILVYSFQIMQKSILYSIKKNQVILKGNILAFVINIFLIFALGALSDLKLNGVFIAGAIGDFLGFYYRKKQLDGVAELFTNAAKT